MKSIIAALLVAAPAIVLAQSSALPTGAASLPSCALTCSIQTLGTGGCTTATDISCVCTSAEYQAAVFQCYVNSCSEADLKSAVAYGAQLCATNGTPLSNTAAIPSGVTGSASDSGSSGTPSTAPESSSFAASNSQSAPVGSSTVQSSEASLVSVGFGSLFLAVFSLFV